jgi:hypothetical protein
MGNRVIGLFFFFEELTVNGDTLLAMMENSALHHVPVGTIFKVNGAPPHFSCCVHAFQDKEFPDLDTKRGTIPWPHHSPDLITLDSFSGGL